MSMISIGPFNYPEWRFPRPKSGSTGKTNANINVDNDWWTFRFTATSSGTIESIWFESGNTLTATGTLRISFQNVASGTYGPDARGDGTDTHWVDVTVDASDTFYLAGPITDNGTATGTRKVVNTGDQIAVVIKRAPSSVFNGDINYLLSSEAAANGTSFAPILSPNNFYSSNAGSSWVFKAGTANLAIKFNDNSFMRNVFHAVSAYNQIGPLASDTTPDEIGIVLVPEVTIQVSGVWVLGGDTNAQIRVYNSSDTVLASQLTGFHGGTNTNGEYRYHFFGPVTLTASNTYRITYTYLDSASQTRMFEIQVPEAAAMDQYPMGTASYRTERTNGGAWTDTTTSKLCMGVVVTGIETSPIAYRGQAMHRINSPINASVARIF